MDKENEMTITTTAAQQTTVDTVIDALTEHGNDLNWQIEVMNIAIKIMKEAQSKADKADAIVNYINSVSIPA